MDLQVDNLIDPDRQKVLGNPEDVQTLVASSFGTQLFAALTGSNATGEVLGPLSFALWGAAGSNITTSLATATSSQWYLDLVEPRPAINNASVITTTLGPHAPRVFWRMLGKPSTDAYDALFLINGGTDIVVDGVDHTARARAMAKLVQGWSWGYQALIFDQVNIVSDTLDMGALSFAELAELPRSSLKSYDEAMVDALASIDEAIQIAQSNPNIVFPATGGPTGQWFGSPTDITSARFVQIANTLAARLLVLNARNPQERQAVDWARVKAYTAGGIQPGNDLGVRLEESRQHTTYLRIHGMGTTTGHPAQLGGYRWDYRTVGMADQSGAYQDWISQPPVNRVRFDIVTPDRRITGPTPTSHGSYTRYRCPATTTPVAPCTAAGEDDGFTASRGSYFMGNYQWARHGIRENLPWDAVALRTADNTGYKTGTTYLATAHENALLRAEAILRTDGVTAEALDLINRSRTASQTTQAGTGHPGAGQTFDGLPPLTMANQGVAPTVDGACVPRRDNGDCGTARTALRYERMVEMAATDVLYGYADSRGFGMLPDGSPEHWPIPGNVLEQYEMAEYTFGGVGGDRSLTYNPWD